MHKMILFAVAILILFSSGCAVLSEKHRHLSKYLDDNLDPQSAALEIALTPVSIPAGLSALVIDGFFINPALALPKAAEDAVSVFTKLDYTGCAEIWVFPMRIITCPIIFVGSELLRCFIPFGDM